MPRPKSKAKSTFEIIEHTRVGKDVVWWIEWEHWKVKVIFSVTFDGSTSSVCLLDLGKLPDNRLIERMSLPADINPEDAFDRIMRLVAWKNDVAEPRRLGQTDERPTAWAHLDQE